MAGDDDEEAQVLFVGDDWAEDHHDVELVDEAGRRLARARLPEGLEGISRLHALIAEHQPAEWADLDAEEAAQRVKVGIETDRGSWVQALVAAGYEVFAINPMQVARYRERHSTSGRPLDTPEHGMSAAGRAPGDEGQRVGAQEPGGGIGIAGRRPARHSGSCRHVRGRRKKLLKPLVEHPGSQAMPRPR